MPVITTPTSGFRRFTRVVAVAGVAILGMALSNGTAAAGIDNVSSAPDSRGNTIEVLQADTRFQVVPPLDSSPISYEFFHDGVVAAKITGPDAESFEGSRLTIGYHIGYPVALPAAVVVLNSPNLDWGLGTSQGIEVGDFLGEPEFALFAENSALIGGSIIPSQELDIELEPGGITVVPLLEDQEFDGNAAAVRLTGIHGSVSGALGPVTIRPYAMVTTENGDTVVTYGMPQRLN